MTSTPISTPTAVEIHALDLLLEPGTMLGDYRIEGKLGEGGWGSVFSAVHPLIGKRAAIKVLKKDLSDPTHVQRFIDEARAVNQIGHPNIVDIFTFGETIDGRSYFVMEWLKGETLAERIDRGSLNLNEICAIVKPLARALEAAHDKGIIHRDLKPANVFLVEVRGEHPNVKLLDFGIAKLQTNELHNIEKTTTGEIIGTPIYIAPEQARGREIDHRVDIYALGGMLFELLTGRNAFVADNAADLIASHLTEPPPRPSSSSLNVPPELDDLVVAMLAKDAKDRPSLDRLCVLLDQIRDGAYLTRASQPRFESSPAASAATAVRMHTPYKWLVGGALAIGLVAFLVVSSNSSKTDLTVEPTPARGGAAIISNELPPSAGSAPVQAVAPADATIPSNERGVADTTNTPKALMPKPAEGQRPATIRKRVVPKPVVPKSVVTKADSDDEHKLYRPGEATGGK